MIKKKEKDVSENGDWLVAQLTGQAFWNNLARKKKKPLWIITAHPNPTANKSPPVLPPWVYEYQFMAPNTIWFTLRNPKLILDRIESNATIQPRNLPQYIYPAINRTKNWIASYLVLSCRQMADIEIAAAGVIFGICINKGTRSGRF